MVLSKAELWRRIAEHNAQDTYERRVRAAEALRRPTYGFPVQSTARHAIVTAQSGRYCVSKNTAERVICIRRENPKTGRWNVVWPTTRRKNIGKRLMAVVTLGDEKAYEASR